MSKFWASNESDSESSHSGTDSDCNDDSSVDWDDESDDDSEVSQGDSPRSNNNDETMSRKDGENFSAKAALTNVKDEPHDSNLKWKDIQQDQVFAAVPMTKSSITKDPGVTRIVCMSDTHAKHRDIPFLPNGDVFIHGGDFTKSGEIGTVQDLSDYFKEHSAQFEQMICIAGNHELTFQPEFYKTARRRHKPKPFDPLETRAALKNCIYLEDTSTSISTSEDGRTDDDIEVYGSPWTPAFYDWAFNLPRGEALDEIWSRIPAATDVLITHGPPLGRGDFTDHSGRVVTTCCSMSRIASGHVCISLGISIRVMGTRLMGKRFLSMHPTWTRTLRSPLAPA